MSIHSGVPRHFCNYCNRSFNNSGNKFKHIKQAHPVEAAMNRRKSIKVKTAEFAASQSTDDVQYQVIPDTDRRKSLKISAELAKNMITIGTNESTTEALIITIQRPQ